MNKIFKLIAFPSFKEWDEYNQKIVGVSYRWLPPRRIIDNCVLILINNFSVKGKNFVEKEVFSVHKIKFIYPKKVLFRDGMSIRGMSWRNNIIIVRKRNLHSITDKINNYLAVYSEIVNKRKEIELQRRKWITEQMRRIQEEADKLFKFGYNSSDLLKYFEGNIQDSRKSYFCNKCNKYYVFEKNKRYCPECGSSLKSSFDKKVRLDMVLDPKLEKSFKKGKK